MVTGGSRFIVADRASGEAVAVVDRTSGRVVAYASELRGFTLARLLNALELTDDQLEALLGDGRGRHLLRTVELRHAAVCRRCGRALSAGARARWNATTRLVQHTRSCPAEISHRGRDAA